MATVNERLFDELTAHAVDLQQYSDGVARRMIALLNRVDADLSAELAAALERMPADSFTVERLEALLGSVRQLNAAAYASVTEALQSELRAFAAYEAGYQSSLYQSVIPAAVQVRYSIASVSPNQVYSAAMSRPFQGRLLKDWASNIEAGRMTKIRDAIRIGYVEGKTASEIVRGIRGTRAAGYADGLLQRPRRDLMAVVQTAISHTAQVARETFNDSNRDLIKAEVWRSTLDTKTSHACFPASTFALPVGDLKGVSRRFWNGDMAVVTTSSGKQIKATPNHPVLTARGWRAIGELRPGEDVLHRVCVDVCGVAAAKDIEMPATLGAIADALQEPAVVDVLVERTSKADFHGDGMLGEHEIYTPRAEGDLRLMLEAKLGKQVAEKLFVLVAEAGRFAPDGERLHLLNGPDFIDMAAKLGAMPLNDGVEAAFADAGCADDVGGLSAIQKHLDDPGLVGALGGLASFQCRHNPGALEDSGDGCCAHTERSSNAGGRGSVRVLTDDVVSVEREFFSGHVINLSTGTELYIADGFIVHNCRIRDGLKYEAGTHKPIGHKVPWLSGPGKIHWNCRSTSTPVTKSWRELGIPIDEMSPSERASMDGQVPAETTFASWLQRQSAARQDQVLGPERGRLIREGGLKLPDLYSPSGRYLTLEELRERDAASFARIAA